jgi:hypothetical protein
MKLFFLADKRNSKNLSLLKENFFSTIEEAVKLSVGILKNSDILYFIGNFE